MPLGLIRKIFGEIYLKDRATKNASKVDKVMNKASGSIKNARANTLKLNDALKAIGGSLVLVKIGNRLKSVSYESLELANKYEQTKIAFTKMLGGLKNATRVLETLDKFSLETPFTPDAVIAAGKSLLAFKLSADKLKPTLKMLGDISAGTGKDLGELSSIYGKVMAKGKADSEALNQLAEAGIPIIDALAASMGIAKENVYDYASKGKVGFTEINKAFQSLVKTGGIYNDMMKEQSLSAEGLKSTVQGYKDTILRSLGFELHKIYKPLLVYLKNVLEKLAALTKTQEGMRKLKGVLIMLGGGLLGFTALILTAVIPTLITLAVTAWAASAPFMPFIIAITAIGIAFGALYMFWPKIKEFFINLPKLVKKGAIETWIFAKKYGKYLIMALFPLSILYFYRDKVFEVLKKIPEYIYKFFHDPLGTVKELWKSSVEGILKLWQKISGIFKKIKNVFGDKDKKVIEITDKTNTTKTRIAGKKASGGYVAAMNTYRVNERGEEFFTPHQSGYIIPASSGAGKVIKIEKLIDKLIIHASTAEAGKKIKEIVYNALNELSYELALEAGIG